MTQIDLATDSRECAFSAKRMSEYSCIVVYCCSVPLIEQRGHVFTNTRTLPSFLLSYVLAMIAGLLQLLHSLASSFVLSVPFFALHSPLLISTVTLTFRSLIDEVFFALNSDYA